MIMGSFDRIATETAHDHETEPGLAAPWSGLERGLGLGGVLGAAQFTSSVTASTIAATSPRPKASYTPMMVLMLASALM
jgi:hypothetical protein